MRRLRLVTAAAVDLITHGVARECAALAQLAAQLSPEDRRSLLDLAGDLVQRASRQSTGPPSGSYQVQGTVT